MANKNLPLRDLASVNTALSLLYDKDGNYRVSFSPEGFYKTQLLNTLEWGSENHVHQMYATTEILKPGQQAVKYRRYRSLTPNLTPLAEGLPNSPDKLAYEEIEISNLFTFGRWYEFTANVDWDVVDPVIARATQNLVDVAARTKELYARKMWLSAPNQYFPNGKNVETLTMADAITLEDLLFITTKMGRLQVKPIGGKYNYICSKEFLRGLIKDPLVREYLSINTVSSSEFLKALNGEPLDLIDVKFVPTMLDEYAYPDIEYPGVYYNAVLDKEVIRFVIDNTVNINKGFGEQGFQYREGTIYYLDFAEDYEVKPSVKIKNVAAGVTYLQDGSAVDNKVTWELPLDANALSVAPGTFATNKYQIKKANVTQAGGHGALVNADAGDLAVINAAIKSGKHFQLPIHRGILFGDEALVKIQHANRGDSAELIIHKPGEAGALDPYNQRQSIAVLVKGFGVGINRTEAICITFGVPYLAAFAYLTPSYINGTGRMLDERGLGGINKINAVTGEQELPVAGINKAAMPLTAYPKFDKAKVYDVGSIVTYKNGIYVFKVKHNVNVDWSDELVVKVAQPIMTDNK